MAKILGDPFKMRLYASAKSTSICIVPRRSIHHTEVR